MLRLAILTALLITVPTTSSPGQTFWQRLTGKRKPTASRPAPQASTARANANFALEQEHGPWLIMASTFSGYGAEQQATKLAEELSQKHGMNAYVHDMQFDLTGDTPGQGVDKYGAPIKMRYRKGERLHEWAVLVGNFSSIEDERAQEMLEKIKVLQPQSLEFNSGEETTQNFAEVRKIQASLVERLKNSKQLGPMRNAFLTSNPILPKEYFVPKGVDKFIEKMNAKVEHSLLDCPGRYSVKVASFQGSTSIEGAATAMQSMSNRRKKKKQEDPLAAAAEKAHLLTMEMRKQGWEAYEFHDRNESYVTVGSFDKIATGRKGQEVPTAKVQEIMRTFGARYNTPATPLAEARLPSSVQAKADEVKQRFSQVFSQEHGQIAGGMTPKFAVVPPKSRNGKVIPFDVHPHPIEAPKRTISGSFAWRN